MLVGGGGYTKSETHTVHGTGMAFGVQGGRLLALFEGLRPPGAPTTTTIYRSRLVFYMS